MFGFRKRAVAADTLQRYHELLPDHLFPVNITQGVIHIHVPKTAGTAIREALFGSNVVKHVPASKVDRILWETLPSFSIVRHPLRRFLSNYKYHCLSRYSGVLLKRNPDLKELSVEQYADRFLNDNLLLESQVSYITRQDSTKKKVDFIVKFEELGSGLDELRRRTGVRIKMERVKVGPIANVDMDASLKAKIEERYREDFEILGY